MVKNKNSFIIILNPIFDYSYELFPNFDTLNY